MLSTIIGLMLSGQCPGGSCPTQPARYYYYVPQQYYLPVAPPPIVVQKPYTIKLSNYTGIRLY